MYISLSFINPDEVESFHNLIVEEYKKSNDPELFSLFDYFDSYFVDTLLNTYSVTNWNQSFEMEMRTSNWAENFHSLFFQRK